MDKTPSILQRKIPESLSGTRLDVALSHVFPEFSRNRLKQWLLTGKLCIVDKHMRPSDKVNGSEAISLTLEAETKTECLPQKIDLEILYEDEHLLVINKPAGLVVHPAAGHASGTLVNALLYTYPFLTELPRAGLIHRLDKDTSGLLIVAKTLIAHHSLVKQLQSRDIHREYRAIVCGVLTAGGTVDAPIGRHPHQRLKMAVLDSGKEACTHYRVLERFQQHSYIKLLLETGRTHQIRVHMAHIHYPIFGDPLYNARLKMPAGISVEAQSILRNFKRQALHAKRLEFRHPMSEEWIEVEVAIPDDMKLLLQTLREKNV